MAADVTANDYPDRLTSALIGSCTNSSYEDISRVVDVVRQARAQLLQHLDAIHARQVDIEQHHVRADREGQREGVLGRIDRLRQAGCAVQENQEKGQEPGKSHRTNTFRANTAG